MTHPLLFKSVFHFSHIVYRFISLWVTLIDFRFSQELSSEFLLMKYANVFKIKYDFPEKSIAVHTWEIWTPLSSTPREWNEMEVGIKGHNIFTNTLNLSERN